MAEPLAETDEIIHKPNQAFVESTNVRQFMQEHGIDNYEELIERTTTDVENVEGRASTGSGTNLSTTSASSSTRTTIRCGMTAGRIAPQKTRVARSEAPWTIRAGDAREKTVKPRTATARSSPTGYPGGEFNIAHNVLDRHAAPDNERRNKVACIWESEDGEIREVTYHELHRQANKVANALEERGIEKGDTVGLYMPMVPEVTSILYGCFEVGAIAVPIFSGFGVDATATRIEDPECSVLFTGDGFQRRGSEVTLKATTDEAIEQAGHVERTIVYDRLGLAVRGEIPWNDDRDEHWEEAVETQDDEYETKSLPSDQESMLLYSSGTMGKPKGIVHTHSGALMQAAKELHFGFDLKPSDRFLLGVGHRLDDGAVDAHRHPRLRRDDVHVRGSARPSPTRPVHRR